MRTRVRRLCPSPGGSGSWTGKTARHRAPRKLQRLLAANPATRGARADGACCPEGPSARGGYGIAPRAELGSAQPPLKCVRLLRMKSCPGTRRARCPLDHPARTRCLRAGRKGGLGTRHRSCGTNRVSERETKIHQQRDGELSSPTRGARPRMSQTLQDDVENDVPRRPGGWSRPSLVTDVEDERQRADQLSRSAGQTRRLTGKRAYLRPRDGGGGQGTRHSVDASRRAVAARAALFARAPRGLEAQRTHPRPRPCLAVALGRPVSE